jgi:hypothetical protein
MLEYHDDRYGPRGGAIWIFVLGPVLLASIAGGIAWAIGRLDFENATGVLLVLFASLTFFLYFLVAITAILISAPTIAQSIEAHRRNPEVRVRFYFGRELAFRTDDIDAVEAFTERSHLRLPSLLSGTGENYRIRLKCNRSILLAGHVRGAAEMAAYLRAFARHT